MMSFSMTLLQTLVKCMLSQQFAVSLLLVLLFPPLMLLVLPALALDVFLKLSSHESRIEHSEHIKVVIVGGGVSGLCAAAKLKEAGITDLLVLEKSSRLGGTWNDNTYPGVACDVPSHLYSFSFFPNPEWTRSYSGGGEIWSYVDSMANHYDLKPHLRLNTKVDEARWMENENVWHITSEQGQKYSANVLIVATGPLSIPKMARFKGDDCFKGRIVHTAMWDSSLDLGGKRVGVIGTGASAVQVVPSIADKVKKLVVFQRTPAWSPERSNSYFPDVVKSLFRICPWAMQILRCLIFLRNEIVFELLFRLDRPLGQLREGFKNYVAKGIRKKLESLDPTVVDNLIPDYELGCKRVTPSNAYLDAFLRENVELETSEISHMTEQSVVTKSGKSHDLDVVVMATGFDVALSVRCMKILGLESKVLADEWDDYPKAYKAISCPNYPNLFYILGPGSGLGHSSVLYMSECQVSYVVDAVRHLANLPRDSALNLKGERAEEYRRWVEEEMSHCSFQHGSCTSWYRNERGVNWTLWPKGLIHYWWTTRKCHINDYHVILSDKKKKKNELNST